MRPPRNATYICLTALMCACSSDPGPDPLDAFPGLDGSCVPGQVWKSTSRAIELKGFDFLLGWSGYRKALPDLSTEQLAALDKLCVITPQAGRGVDAYTFTVAITDADGTVAHYWGVDGDFSEGVVLPPAGLPSLGSTQIRAFRGTFSCLSETETHRSQPVRATVDGGDAGVEDATREATSPDAVAANDDASDGAEHQGDGAIQDGAILDGFPEAAVEGSQAADAASLAPLVGNDPGCLNGVSAGSTCTDILLRVSISTSGVYELATEQCRSGQEASIELFSEDGSTPLAASNAATAPLCASMTYTFSHAGVYPVELHRHNSVCLLASAGLLFRVTPVK